MFFRGGWWGRVLFVLTGHPRAPRPRRLGCITSRLAAEPSVAAPQRLSRISLNELFEVGRGLKKNK